jgi:hypothetical protein
MLSRLSISGQWTARPNDALAFGRTNEGECMTTLTIKQRAELRLWLAGLLLLVTATGYTWATWRYFTLPVPGGNDFLARYTAWEAYLKHGLNPYSDEATLHTHMAFYGRPALPEEDQQRLTYPFYSILVHGPFVFFDYAFARALHMVALQAAVLIGVACTLPVLNWKPPLWLWASILVWSLLMYPQARAVILGQVALFGFLSLAGSLALLRAGRPGAAGALLVLSTVKPTLIFLVVPYLLIWALVRRRWRFVAGFSMTLAVLVMASLAAVPTWIGDWLARVQQYPAYTVGESPVWLLTHQALPWLGRPVEIALTVGMLAGLMAVWWLSLRRDPARTGEPDFHWVLGVTLVVSNLIVPRSATTNYVLMLVPTLWVLATLDRWRPAGRLGVVGILLISLVGHWWLHLATVVGNQEQPVLYLPWPLALLAVLMVARRWLLRQTVLARLWPAPAETQPLHDLNPTRP